MRPEWRICKLKDFSKQCQTNPTRLLKGILSVTKHGHITPYKELWTNNLSLPCHLDDNQSFTLCVNSIIYSVRKLNLDTALFLLSPRKEKELPSSPVLF